MTHSRRPGLIRSVANARRVGKRFFAGIAVNASNDVNVTITGKGGICGNVSNGAIEGIGSVGGIPGNAGIAGEVSRPGVPGFFRHVEVTVVRVHAVRYTGPRATCSGRATVASENVLIHAVDPSAPTQDSP